MFIHCGTSFLGLIARSSEIRTTSTRKRLLGEVLLLGKGNIRLMCSQSVCGCMAMQQVRTTMIMQTDGMRWGTSLHVNHVTTSTLPKMYIPYMQPQNGHIIFQRTIIFQIAFLRFHLKLGCGVFPGATKGGNEDGRCIRITVPLQLCLGGDLQLICLLKIKISVEFCPVYRTRWSQLNWSPPGCPWNQVPSRRVTQHDPDIAGDVWASSKRPVGMKPADT